MKGNELVSAMLTLAVLLFLSLVPGAAQGPEPPRESIPRATLGEALTYQGRLVDDGSPVADNCNFQFSLYDDPIMGPLVVGLISYYDNTSDDLKVAHCSSPFCVPYWRRR